MGLLLIFVLSILVMLPAFSWSAPPRPAAEMEILTGDDMFAKDRLVVDWYGQGADIIPSLLPLLEHAHRDVRAAAIDALAHIPDPRSLEALTVTLRRYGPLPRPNETFADEYLRTLAIQGLGTLGMTGPEDWLKQVLASPNPYDAAWASVSLGHLKVPEGPKALLGMLSSENADIRTLVAGNLGSFPSEGVETALIAALDDKDWVVRERAAYSLGQLHSGASKLKALATGDPSPFVRRTASEATAPSRSLTP